MTEKIHAIDEFESTYMRQSIYDCLQNGIRNLPEMKSQIEQTFQGKTIISDIDYNAMYAHYIAEMIKPQ